MNGRAIWLFGLHLMGCSGGTFTTAPSAVGGSAALATGSSAALAAGGARVASKDSASTSGSGGSSGSAARTSPLIGSGGSLAEGSTDTVARGIGGSSATDFTKSSPPVLGGATGSSSGSLTQLGTAVVSARSTGGAAPTSVGMTTSVPIVGSSTSGGSSSAPQGEGGSVEASRITTNAALAAGAPPAAAGGSSSSRGATGTSTLAGGATADSAGGSSSVRIDASASVRWIGRVDASNPSAVKFDWQGAGLTAKVEGSTIAVRLRTEGTVFFQPVVDGVAATRFKVDAGNEQVVTIATGLSAGDHIVELFRDSESSFGLSTFLGFSSGTLKGAPPFNGRLIEVVGDSVSAGYGNLGAEPHPDWVANPACHQTAENSSWYATYAAIAGRNKRAQVSTLAQSGWGVYRDLNGSTENVLPSVYRRTIAANDTPRWNFASQASVVLVNLGAGDWYTGDPGYAFEAAYVAFVAELRAVYPNAWIFLTIGPVMPEQELDQVKTRIANVVSSISDSTGSQRVFAFDFGIQDLGWDGSVATGCDWNPSLQEHQRMAEILEQQLSEKLGW